MLSQIKPWLIRQPAVRDLWSVVRRRQLLRQYTARREHYARLAEERGLVYREESAANDVGRRLRGRGYHAARRNLGEVHTFAFIPRIAWHSALYPDLARLGPVSEFDYAAAGYSWQEFFRRDRRAAQRRREMNDLAMQALREAHARRSVDWVFVYASGLEVRAEWIRAIVEELGLPVVNMCLDDKQSWDGPVLDGQRLGQIDIAAEFDLSWTSARVACEWYLVEGARPIYLPEGFDAETFHPIDVPRDIPVSFIGGAYGFRPAVIRHLRKHRVPIKVYGPGWNTESVWGAAQTEIFNRSVVNLGLGGIGYSEELTNVKTRDFEIPGTGGGVYLTSFNPDLARHFDIGREIVCYRNRQEMVELIRYYLARPDEAAEIGRRGRQRCLREHRWLHRYVRLCEALGILEPADGSARDQVVRDTLGRPVRAATTTAGARAATEPSFIAR